MLTVPSLDQAFGGPTHKARRLALELRKLGHQVALVGSGAGGAGATGLGRLGSFHSTPVPARMGPLLAAVRDADIVHVLGERDPVGTTAALVAWGLRVPCVLEPCGMHRRRLRSVRLKGAFDASVGRLVQTSAACLVATSELERAELMVDGIDETRVTMRANGVELDDVLPPRGALRARLGIPIEVPLVLSLGRITAKKGLELFAQSLASLPELWGLVAGPDDGDGTLAELRALSSRLCLGDRLVIAPGGLWGPERTQAYVDADAFCLASRTENFATAAAEAACLGLPVVVSDQCGVAEWLDPVASRVVPYGDPEALTMALRSVLTGNTARDAARAAAPALQAGLNWQRLAETQVEVYEQILARRGA